MADDGTRSLCRAMIKEPSQNYGACMILTSAISSAHNSNSSLQSPIFLLFIKGWCAMTISLHAPKCAPLRDWDRSSGGGPVVRGRPHRRNVRCAKRRSYAS